MTLFQWLRSWFATCPAPAPQPTPPPSDPIAALNAARAARGLAGLKEDPRLMSEAAYWAGVMAFQNQMRDQPLSGLMSVLNCPVAACVAEGQPDAASVVVAWAADSFHASILFGEWTHCGIGHVGQYWCADFCKEGVIDALRF